MPITEKSYPDWVQEQRVRGTTVKKKGDTYKGAETGTEFPLSV